MGRLLMVLWLVMLLALPMVVIGQEVTPEAVTTAQSDSTSVATLETASGEPVAWFYNYDLLVVVSGVVLLFLFGGAFYLIHEALESAGENVSPEVFKVFGDALVRGMDATLAKLIERAEATPNPYDDLAVGLARIPIERLIEDLRSRGYDVVSAERGVDVKVE